jgi:hypothetical protein
MPRHIGLHCFERCAISFSGLPSGKSVLVTVTARNEAGETLPTSRTIAIA